MLLKIGRVTSRQICVMERLNVVFHIGDVANLCNRGRIAMNLCNRSRVVELFCNRDHVAEDLSPHALQYWLCFRNIIGVAIHEILIERVRGESAMGACVWRERGKARGGKEKAADGGRPPAIAGGAEAM